MVHSHTIGRKPSKKAKRAVHPVSIALFILPAFILFTIFLLYPLFSALSYSFFDWKGTTRGEFLGFANFATLITDLPYKDSLPRAFGHNILFFCGLFVAQNTLGLFVAYQLNKRIRIQRFFQTVFAMPYLLSPLVVGYLWTLILSPSFGPLNALFKAVGLDSLALPWLGDPTLALIIIILITIWQWLGFPILLYGAGLAGIPQEYAEAAGIDGATGFQGFRHITLPLLLPVLSTVSILTFIYAMEIFPLVYAIGGSSGSPAGATDVMALLFYRASFQSGTPNAIGVSSAIATILFLAIFGIATIATKFLRSWERKLS